MNFHNLKSLLAAIFCLASATAWAQDPLSALMPLPDDIQVTHARPLSFAKGENTYWCNTTQASPELDFLTDLFRDEMSVGLTPGKQQSARVKIFLLPDELQEQQYRLQVNSRTLEISGGSTQAIFYGLVTLRQILVGDVCSTSRQEIATLRIDDQPRFAYRALMLDPARHFLPVEDVKYFIDVMANFKYNVLQLHLTDDQGWRIEVKSHPELASKEHYTQDELRELVRYAAERHVEIVPEMDIPGHTGSILSVHPELCCDVPDSVKTLARKNLKMMLCASHDEVYSLYADIFEELASVFSSPYLHLGGDESAIDLNWARCKDCRALMARNNWSEPRQIMNLFFGKMLELVGKTGKQPILWCELDKIWPPAKEYLFPYPEDVILVSWRNRLTPKCLELTEKHGHELILAPGEYAYFDYPQYKGDLPEFNNWGMPVTTLEKVYTFDPGYGLDPEKTAHVKGVMGTLWGEAIADINRATYMAYPRALALAEAAWTQMEHRDWNSFKQRMFPNLYWLMKKGVSVRVPFEVVVREQSVYAK